MALCHDLEGWDRGCIYIHMYNGIDEAICRVGLETQTRKRLKDMAGVGEGRRGWDVWREQYGNIHYHM